MADYDVSRARWRKSSYSGGTGGNCVEVAENLPGVIAVRHSRNPQGPVLMLGSDQWTAFIVEAKTGGFDLT